ncbi:MAG: SRPBCC family protein [Micromonosporaceae bacterium]
MSEIRTIEITRTYDAPPATVFAAWTEPEQFASWFGAPVDTVAMDVRPGGTWKATLSYEGAEIPFHGVYLEVVEPRRLVFTLVDPNDPDFATRQTEGTAEEAVTLRFTEANGGTVMTFEQKGSLPEEEIEQARAGWIGWFDALGQHLASHPS